jgi:hypothetical protein
MENRSRMRTLATSIALAAAIPATSTTLTYTPMDPRSGQPGTPVPVALRAPPC